MTKSRKLNAPVRSAAGSWTVVRSRFEGDTLDTVFRFWVGLPTPPVRAHYPRKVILRWAYAAGADGMPDVALLERMAKFEDAMDARLKTLESDAAHAVHVATLTGNGRRTWRYFARDAEAFLAAVQPVMAAADPAVECFRNEPDPKWEALTDLLGMLD